MKNEKLRHEKLMTDFSRLLKTQDFKSEDEVKKFMKELEGKEIPSFPNEALSTEEKAEDMVFDAWESKVGEGIKIAKEALRLDPHCISAYEFLASTGFTFKETLSYVNRGIAAAREKFGEAYLKENKGNFWDHNEARPFIRLLEFLADMMHEMGEIGECVALLEEIIELDQGDHTGSRYVLMTYCIEYGFDSKFRKYQKMFRHDTSIFMLYNQALFEFKKHGDTDKARKLLANAIEINNHVIKMLPSSYKLPRISDYFQFRSPDEAANYVEITRPAWKTALGAIGWATKAQKK